ncbi:MAG TPA: DoxX family protein [Candidatus Acidoferrum sp.]|jgi:putative oxidoreductase|nr:DoxX family protein [Candidatus Acidoferrum sp.]
MKTLQTLFKTNDSVTSLIPRLALGLVMFPHGAQKALGWFGGYGFHGTMGFFTGQLHIPALFAFLAIAAEFAGSIGLITGFLSRVAAFGIAVEMVVAIILVHGANGFFMNWYGNQKGEGFEYHLLTLGLAVGVILAGAGKWSIDSVLSRRFESTQTSNSKTATATVGNPGLANLVTR